MLPALQVEEEMDPWEILMQITSRRAMIMTSRKSPIPIAAKLLVPLGCRLCS